MFEWLTFIVSKLMRRLRPPALRRCKIDPSACVLGSSDLSDVEMGRYSYCGYGCQIANCQIGSFCSIADRVVIGRGEHPLSAVSTSPVFHSGRNVFRRNFAKHPFERGGTTVIENDVWIGVGAIVKAGVRIGNGAVIGAGSVVTKDVAPYSISAGVPARELGKRFDDTTCRALLEMRWWDLSEEQLGHWGESFAHPNELLHRKIADSE